MAHRHSKASSTDATLTGAVNGSNKTYTLPTSPIAGFVQLWINGLQQYQTDDFAESGDDIVLVIAPETDDTLEVRYEVNA